MSEKNLIVRFSVKDQDIVKRALTQLGDDGQKVLSRLEQSTRSPTAGFKALSATIGEGHALIEKFAEEGGGLGRILSSMGAGGVLAAAGIGALSLGLEKSLESYAEFERLQLRLQGVLNVTGNAAGLNAKEMVDLAEEIEKATFSTKEQVLQAEGVLATFGNVTGENFKKAIELSASMAEIMGTDVADAARTLGKALTDPEEGMQALRRAGVVLTESEKLVIKSLEDSGKAAEAQGTLIEDLAKRYDGVAKESAEGLAGSMKHLKDSFHDVFEASGELVGSTGEVTGFFDAVEKKAVHFAEAIKTITEFMKRMGIESANLSTLAPDELQERSVQNKEKIKDLEKQLYETQHPFVGNFLASTFGHQAEYIAKINDELSIQKKESKEIWDLMHKPENLVNNEPKVSEGYKEYIKAREHELDLAKLSDRNRVREEAQEKAISIARKEGIQLSPEQIKYAGDVAAKIYDQQHAMDGLNKAVNDNIDIEAERQKLLEKIYDVEAETNAIKNGTENEYKIQKEINAARKEALDLSEMDRELLLERLDTALHQKDAEEEIKQQREDALKELQKQAEEQQKLIQEPYLNAARGIQDAFSSTFEDIFNKGINSFSDLATKIKSVMVKMAAEIAAAMVFKPVVGGVLGSISPSLAQSFAGSSAGIGGASGFSFGNISSLFSTIGSSGNLSIPFANAASSLFGGTSSAVNTAFDIGTNFTPGAGLAGIGGNLLGNLIFGGNRGVGASIGGTIGGIAGTAFGGPVGAFLGSLAGNAIGGLFGNNKPSNRLQDSIINLSNGSIVQGGQTGKKLDPKTREQVDSITAAATSIAGAISTSLGQSITQQIRIAVGGRTGFQAGAVGSEVTYGSVQDLLKGVTLSLTSGLKNVPAELKTALDHLDFKNVEQAVNDINFALNFGKLGDMPKTLTQVEAAVQGLNKQFDDAVNVAHRLGLSEAEVSTARQKQLGYLRDQFNTSINDQILALADNTASQIVTIQREFENNLKDATALGATTSQIEQLRDLKIKAALEQQISQQTQEQNKLLTEQANTFSQAKSKWESFTASIKSYEKSLNLSNLSPLSPEARLSEARSQFESLASRAQLGDQDAIAELQNASSSLLQESKSYYASSENYFRDFNRVQDVLKNTEELSIRQSSIADRQLSETQKQTELLQKIADGTASISPAGNANTKLLASEHIVNGKRMFGNATEDQVWAAILASGFTGQGGGGAVTRFFDSNAAANTKATSLFKALGVPGFANGGTASGLFMAGENGKELIYTPPSMPVRVLNNSDTSRVLRGSNDNSDVVNAIKNMHADHNTAWQRASQQNAALRAEVAQLRAENTDIKNYLRKVASKP